MKKHYFKIFILCCLFLAAAGSVSSQRVQFFEHSTLLADPSDRLELIGFLSDHYIAFRQRPYQYPELVVIDQLGRAGGSTMLKFIDPSWMNRVNIFIKNQELLYILQGQYEGKHYLITARSNENGELLEPIRYIDTTDYNAYGSMAYYQVVQSPDNNHTVMYRFASGFSHSLLLFNAFLTDRTGISRGKTLTYVPLNDELELPGQVFVNNDGQLFFTIFDKPGNFKLGTELRIYQSAMDNSPPSLLNVYLKENKPADLLMSWSETKKQLVLGGLYYNFYSKHIEGAMYVFVDPVRQHCDTIVYQKMDKSFKKQLRDKIYNLSRSEVIDNLRCRYFGLSKDDTPILVADMFNNSDLSSKSSRMPLPVSDPNLPVGRFQQGNTIAPPNTFRQEIINQFPNYNPSGNSNSFSNRLLNQGRNEVSANETATPAKVTLTQPVDEKSRLFSRSGTSDFIKGWPSPGRQDFKTYNDDILAVNKNMDFKTVLFGLDRSLTEIRPKWLRSLYVPQTLYSVAVLLPGEEDMGLISYEINSKNNPYMLFQSFSGKSADSEKVILTEQHPVLFKLGASVLKTPRTIATLYQNPVTGKMGLAEIAW